MENTVLVDVVFLMINCKCIFDLYFVCLSSLPPQVTSK